MSINRYRLKHLAKNGNAGAKLATKLLQETDKLLSVILLCNNFSNAAAATLVTVIAVQLYGDQQYIILVGTFITTFLILIFSEISPKVIAAAHPERLALSCSFLLYPLLKILYPIVLFVNIFVLGILKIFNIKINFAQNNLITMDELKSIISDSGKFIPSKNKSLLLNYLDPSFSYESSKKIKTPDIFHLIWNGRDLLINKYFKYKDDLDQFACDVSETPRGW